MESKSHPLVGAPQSEQPVTPQATPPPLLVRLLRRGWFRALLALAALFLLLLVGGLLYLRSGTFDPHRLQEREIASLQILDRYGGLLREFAGSKSRYHHWVPLKEIAPAVITAFVQSEDRDFFSHAGVSYPALVRAFLSNIASGRVVSGASTITMQLIRLLTPRPRTLASKIQEIREAHALERHVQKNEILEQYLNRLPFGHGIVGIEAGAQRYFGRGAAHLSPAQAAFLAVVPRAPGHYDPLRSFSRVRAMQRHLLRAMARSGDLTEEQLHVALGEPLELAPHSSAFRAPHFTRHLRKRLEEGSAGLPQGLLLFTTPTRPWRVRSTIDPELQQFAEATLQNTLARLKKRNVTNGAVLVLENRTAHVLAWVGSRLFFDASTSGQVDGVLALRQPGSALKPFTYAMALEKGYTPATVIPDIRVTYLLASGNTFVPRNFSNHYYGPVRLRSALASSLNTSAFQVARYVGLPSLLRRFTALGFPLEEGAAHYGLGITMGNGEVTLFSLARAYLTLAYGGLYREPQLWTRVHAEDSLHTPPPIVERRLFKKYAAYLITHILADNLARVRGFGFHTPFNFPYEIAVKTGTSSNFRDNIVVGYSSQYTVAVWVGNFDGQPMQNVTGASGAGPIFRELILYLHRKAPPPPFTAPGPLLQERICPLSGERPGPHCPHTFVEVFQPGTEPRTTCGYHRSLLVERKTGLLATPRCPKSTVERRIYAVYPPLYSEFVREEGVVTAPSAYSPRCPPPPNTRAPVITSPRDGAHFLLDPTSAPQYQQLQLRIRPGTSGEPINWYVNGRLFRRASPSQVLYWPLSKGTHQIWCQQGEARSKTVRITVR